MKARAAAGPTEFATALRLSLALSHTASPLVEKMSVGHLLKMP